MRPAEGVPLNSVKPNREAIHAVQVRYGAYPKLTRQEADSGLHGPCGLTLARVDEHRSVIRALRSMVVADRGGGASLADWLNDQGVKPPPYAKSRKWRGRVVIDLLRDEILYMNSRTRRF